MFSKAHCERKSSSALTGNTQDFGRICLVLQKVRELLVNLDVSACDRKVICLEKKVRALGFDPASNAAGAHDIRTEANTKRLFLITVSFLLGEKNPHQSGLQDVQR
jgi:hypothetical protein